MEKKEVLHEELKSCKDSDEFFDILSKCVGFEIPLQLRKILKLNLCDSVVALSGCIEKSIVEMEDFMRNKFTKTMVAKTEKISDYLVTFSNDQKKFEFLSGQKRTLSVLSDYCNKVLKEESTTQPNIKLPQQNIVLKAMYDTLYAWIVGQRDLFEV